jgi:hypothetical protein
METVLLLVALGAVAYFFYQATGGVSSNGTGGCCGVNLNFPDTGSDSVPDNSATPAPANNSSLSDIVARLESGGGANVAGQPASMVNPTYGQYAGFTTQYGSGAAGVDNYAYQVLADNPNATLGDFYASYVLGTGNPANLSSASDLQAKYPSAYNNLVKNAGVGLNTPLSSLI